MAAFFLAAYVILTLVFAVTGGWRAGLAVSLYTLTTAMLFVISGARLRQIARVWHRRGPKSDARDRDMMIGGVIAAAIAAGIGQWLSGGFSVQIASNVFPGWAWGWLGFVIAGLAF